MKKQPSGTPEKGNAAPGAAAAPERCDVCLRKDGSRGFILQKCKTCGLNVHGDCYGMAESTEKNPDWQCWACRAIGKIIEGRKPGREDRHGRDQPGYLEKVVQTARPTRCELCSITDGIHAMHPLYDAPGKKGRQLLLPATGGAEKDVQPAWVHTLCAMAHAASRSSTGVYGCDVNGVFENADDDEKDDKSATSESSKEGMADTHHFVISGMDFVTGDEMNSTWIPHIQEFRDSVVCHVCGRKSKRNPDLRIPIQCCAGEEDEYEEFRKVHSNAECFQGMHVGCAMWGKHGRARQVFFYPGTYKDATVFQEPVSEFFCPKHANELPQNASKRSSLVQRASSKSLLRLEPQTFGEKESEMKQLEKIPNNDFADKKSPVRQKGLKSLHKDLETRRKSTYSPKVSTRPKSKELADNCPTLPSLEVDRKSNPSNKSTSTAPEYKVPKKRKASDSRVETPSAQASAHSKTEEQSEAAITSNLPDKAAIATPESSVPPIKKHKVDTVAMPILTTSKTQMKAIPTLSKKEPSAVSEPAKGNVLTPSSSSLEPTNPPVRLVSNEVVDKRPTLAQSDQAKKLITISVDAKPEVEQWNLAPTSFHFPPKTKLSLSLANVLVGQVKCAVVIRADPKGEGAAAGVQAGDAFCHFHSTDTQKVFMSVDAIKKLSLSGHPIVFRVARDPTVFKKVGSAPTSNSKVATALEDKVATTGKEAVEDPQDMNTVAVDLPLSTTKEDAPVPDSSDPKQANGGNPWASLWVENAKPFVFGEWDTKETVQERMVYS